MDVVEVIVLCPVIIVFLIMAAEIAAGLLSGAAGIAGSLINAQAANAINERQIKLAQYGYQMERKMIQEQNEYNSPVQQLQRYVDAGLNPNLIYGEGKASAGNQSSIASYRAPSLNVPQPGTGIGDIGNAVGIAVQAGLARAQMDKLANDSYASNMLGQKYEQERYNMWLRNMYDSVVMGVQPGVIHTGNDIEGIKGSEKLRQFKADVIHSELMNDLVRSQQAMNSVNTKLASMKVDAQKYYNDNIQPLVSSIMEKKAFGLDISNDLLSLQKKFFTADKWFHYGETLLRDIMNAINMFKSPLPDSFGGAPYQGWPSSPSIP